MSASISLSALKAAHEAATGLPWIMDKTGIGTLGVYGRNGYREEACVAVEFSRRDADAIVAEHNATSVLLEIAEAALAHIDAVASNGGIYDGTWEALFAALAKVRP